MSGDLPNQSGDPSQLFQPDDAMATIGTHRVLAYDRGRQSGEESTPNIYSA